MLAKKKIFIFLITTLFIFTTAFIYNGIIQEKVKNIKKSEQLACPCGGHCETDPSGVCTICSEWEIGSKFVRCPGDDIPIE